MAVATEATPIDLWVGTSLGVLKGVSLSTRETTNFLPGDLSLQQTDKSREVCVMCWEHQSQEKCAELLRAEKATEAMLKSIRYRLLSGRLAFHSYSLIGAIWIYIYTEELYVGLKNGRVQCFNCADRLFTAECDCTGSEGELVGLGKHEDVLITCTDKGSLSFWLPDQEKTEHLVGSELSRMAANPEVMLQVATGGKGNDLKLWNGNRLDTPVFQAKNVRHDSLNLPVPVWVREVGFVPGSGEQPTIAVGTGYHQVRLYDTRAQRRPVYSQEFGEAPVTALCVVEDGRSFLAGNAVGEVARFDLRKGSVINHYKGFAGGVRSLQCHSSCDGHSLVAGCGLDRFLRVFQMEPPKLLHQMYLKLQCSCLLWTDDLDSELLHVESGKEGVVDDAHPPPEDSGGSGSEDDDVWAAMETVGPGGEGKRKKAKKRKGAKPGKTKTKRKKTSEQT